MVSYKAPLRTGPVGTVQPLCCRCGSVLPTRSHTSERARLVSSVLSQWKPVAFSGRLVLVAVIARCVGLARNRRNIGRVFGTFRSWIFVALLLLQFCGQIVVLYINSVWDQHQLKPPLHTNPGILRPLHFSMIIEHLFPRGLAQSGAHPQGSFSLCVFPYPCIRPASVCLSADAMFTLRWVFIFMEEHKQFSLLQTVHVHVQMMFSNASTRLHYWTRMSFLSCRVPHDSSSLAPEYLFQVLQLLEVSGS